MKTLTRALCAVAALLACADASAVFLSPRGTGQVLLFPYYTANAGNQTLITLVNTTARAKAVKVRIHEARNGRAVFELNLYLGGNDTWAAAVFGVDGHGVARIGTNDRSCTIGLPPPEFTDFAIASFSAAAYTGANQDWSSTGTPAAVAQLLGGPARTRDGYVEVIEMGELQSGTGPLQLAEEVDPTRAGATCAELQAAWAVSDANNWSDDPTQAIDLPRGGLLGNGAIIDVARGSMFTYTATALDDFYTYAAAPGALHAAAGSGRPDLRDARNGVDSVRSRADAVNTSIAQETFPLARAIDAVSLALLQGAIWNEFNVDPAIGAANEWVITMPTRRFYSDVASDALVQLPFTDAFGDDGSATEEITVEFYDREERVPGTPPCPVDVLCPPNPNPPPLPSLDDAANIVVFKLEAVALADASPIFLVPFSANGQGFRVVDITGRPFDAGWSYIRLNDPTTIANDNRLPVPGTDRSYIGLPVVGFAVTRIINTQAQPGLLANYGDAVDHGGEVRVVATPAAASATEGQP
jgi:hypothetical protein